MKQINSPSISLDTILKNSKQAISAAGMGIALVIGIPAAIGIGLNAGMYLDYTTKFTFAEPTTYSSDQKFPENLCTHLDKSYKENSSFKENWYRYGAMLACKQHFN